MKGHADYVYELGRRVGEHLHEMHWLDDGDKMSLMFSLGVAAGAMAERERAERVEAEKATP